MIKLLTNNYSLKELNELIRILETAKDESIVGDCDEEECYNPDSPSCKYCLYKYLCDDLSRTIGTAKDKQSELLVNQAKKKEKILSRLREKY